MTPGESTREYYRLQGKLAEQARIIKLLERQLELAATASKKPEKERYLMGWQDAIALIKGEIE